MEDAPAAIRASPRRFVANVRRAAWRVRYADSMETAAPARPYRPARQADEFHPLEIIGYFRRWPPGPLRDVLYTFVWNCLLAALFYVGAVLFSPGVPSWRSFFFSVLMVQVIGYSIHGAFIVGDGIGLCRRARQSGALASVAYYTAMSTLGVLLGYCLLYTSDAADE